MMKKPSSVQIKSVLSPLSMQRDVSNPQLCSNPYCQKAITIPVTLDIQSCIKKSRTRGRGKGKK